MGRSRLLHRGLIPLLLLAACGGDDDLLVAKDLSVIYSGGGAGGGYGPSAGGAPGRITGKVRFEGTGWQPRKLDITTADGFCVSGHGAAGLMSEDFILGPDNGVANVVVYVKEGASGGKWDPPEEAVVLDQVKCQYVPHVAVLRVGQPLIIKSDDKTLHNVHMTGPAVPGGELNQSMSRPAQLDPIAFRKEEVAQRVYCDVHSWMEAWLVILPHPFHDVTGEDGAFTIENVPPGKYRLAAWQEKLKEKSPEQDVVVTAGGTATVEFVLTR